MLPAPPPTSSPGTPSTGLAAAAPAATPAQAAPAMDRAWRLPPSGVWTYALRWRGEQGQAWLHWQQDGDRYQLLLERRTPDRQLPVWRSSGWLDPRSGLRPERFSTEGRRGERTLPLPDDAIQDRLSWMLQAASLAARQGLRPGGRLQLDVVGWRGERQRWLLLAERDPEAPGLLRLRRLPPEGGALEQLLWLDPAQHYRPVRLSLRYDEAERWELLTE